VLLLSACAVGPEPGAPADAVPLEPEVRVGLLVAAATAELGGGDPLIVINGTGMALVELPAGASTRLTPAPDGVALRLGATTVRATGAVVVRAATAAGTVRVNGRDYRGTVTVHAAPDGLAVVNRLGLEDYLAGVVNAEMGRRGAGEDAALQAQAIVSRTYALRILGRTRGSAFDVTATVAHQAYGGLASETAAGRAAVASTRGTVLTWQGQPIEAFFHSTCAGRTAAGAEVFVNGALPYLTSVSDQAPDGEAWCATSPRYRWREEWTGDRLLATLRATLPPLGVPATRIDEVRDVVITARTGSSRVAEVRFQFRTGPVPVVGQPIRQVLSPAPDQTLRSTVFDVHVTRAGNRIERLVVTGGGAGHGVGMCQWGAVGRARAGQSAAQILAAYFPGTVLEPRW
jgi:stage II sporulation protein D